MTSIATQHQPTQVARPLIVLVPLIKQDLQQGNEAAKTASEPYYRAAGEKMIEAKASPEMKHGTFEAWIKRHFDIFHHTPVGIWHSRVQPLIRKTREASVLKTSVTSCARKAATQPMERSRANENGMSRSRKVSNRPSARQRSYKRKI